MTTVLFFIAFIVVFLYSVILHEIAHGWAALQLGDRTAKDLDRLTLNPIPHLDPVGSVLLPVLAYLGFGVFFGYAKPVPFDPNNLRDQRWGPALVAGAGPLTNLILALGAAAVLLVDQFVLHLGPYNLGMQVMTAAMIINILLMTFNLLPIPPLDGSRFLYAVLPASAQALKENLERYGFIILVVVLVLGGGAVSAVIGFVFNLFLNITGVDPLYLTALPGIF